MPLYKVKNGSLPHAPNPPLEWGASNKITWFAAVVKFHHRCQEAGEQSRIRDKEILIASAWERGEKHLDQYRATLNLIQNARDDGWRF
jgi:hypothetical protein